jgi:integrase
MQARAKAQRARIDQSEEHIHKLREYLRGYHLEAILTLALVTGMRRDELLHLTWSEVDLEKREMHVWNSKTKSSSRLVHLSEECVQLLRQYRQHQMEQSVERGLDWQNLDLVFSDRVGGFLEPQHFLKR